MPAVIIVPDWLVVDSEPIGTWAEKVKDPLKLKGGTARGENRKKPGAAGRKKRRKRPDEISVSIDILVNGLRQRDGTPYSNKRQGLDLNIEFLRVLLFDQPTIGSKPGELHLGGTTYLADIQVDSFDVVGTGPTTATVSAHIIVPAGRWT